MKDYQNKMEANVVQYEIRIKKLLEKMLEPDFQMCNEGYLGTFLTHLSGKANPEFGESLISLPVFTEWLVHAISFWEKTNTRVSGSTLSFTLNLLSILSKKEGTFLYYLENDLYDRVFKYCAKNQHSIASVKLAQIKILDSLLQHSAGIDWVTSTVYWESALKYSLESHTLYLTKEGHSFIFNLLLKTADHNEVFCNSVVFKIVSPLHENSQKNGISTEVNDEILKANLTPSLKLISFILTSCLEGECFIKEDFRIPSMFLINNHLEQAACSFLMMVHDQDLLFDFGSILHSAYFLDLAMGATNSTTFSYKEVISTGKKLFSILSMNISKGYILNVLKFSYLGHRYWKSIYPRMPVNEAVGDKEPILFENQLIVIQMLPVCFICMKHGDINYVELEGSMDEFRECYVNKLFKVVCEATIRLIYNWRNVVMQESNIFEHGIKSIAYILKSKEYYHRDRAVMMFQSFMYAIKDILMAVKEKPAVLDAFVKEVTFMTALLNAIAVFISDFQITWRESVETICVLGGAIDFISIPQWPSRVIVQALKLVNLSIAKYMAPNLALLVDRTAGSSLSLLGPMLNTRLHDLNWEVRDSALEVVHTISDIANNKFPAFQKLLLQEKLPLLVVVMMMSDGESFVRASALKCLQEMIKIQAVWCSVLASQKLPEKIMQILSEETEAIVRIEAATLMCRIYEYQTLPEDVMEEVYKTMSYAATVDLHWEVKVKALDFWSKVICSHLSNQGMIDGTFPHVTFSKENRKIVTLTEMEIKKRLRKVLMQLSECGCLGVLMTAMQDGCDLEVAKRAVQKTKRFVDLLNAYDVNLKSSLPNSPVENTTLQEISFCSTSSKSLETSDRIINEICNSKDVNLLVGVFNANLTNEGTNKKLNIVSPDHFLSFVQRDLNTLINTRTEWLNNINDFGSLLDDMLKDYDEGINNIDCY